MLGIFLREDAAFDCFETEFWFHKEAMSLPLATILKTKEEKKTVIILEREHF